MTDLERKLQGIADAGGDPWAAMSMGGGRELPGYPGDGCPGSADGSHKMVAVSCVQSVEHFVCQNEGCDRQYYD